MQTLLVVLAIALVLGAIYLGHLAAKKRREGFDAKIRNSHYSR